MELVLFFCRKLPWLTLQKDTIDQRAKQPHEKGVMRAVTHNGSCGNLIAAGHQ